MRVRCLSSPERASISMAAVSTSGHLTDTPSPDASLSPPALQAKILKTAGAFHTPLMQPAQDKPIY